MLGQRNVPVSVKLWKYVEAFRKSGNRPKWMMHPLFLLSTDLRPMVQLDGSCFATSYLNNLYEELSTETHRTEKTIWSLVLLTSLFVMKNVCFRKQ